MNDVKSRYNVIKYKDYLYIIQESITDIHPVYKNSPLNLYLLLGSQKALLIDTGCRIEPLKSIVDKLIGEKELMVLNTHAHWDHVLGNMDFKEVFIHANDSHVISKPYNVSFLKDSPYDTIKTHEKFNFLIPPAKKIRILQDGDTFNLGDLIVRVIHAPGHSPGSICLYTNKNELFTGDVAYYGEHFLPKREDFPIVLNTLEKLIKICTANEKFSLFPSHTKTPCDRELLMALKEGIEKIDNLWDARKRHAFFPAYEIKDDKFTYYISLF